MTKRHIKNNFTLHEIQLSNIIMDRLRAYQGRRQLGYLYAARDVMAYMEKNFLLEERYLQIRQK